MTTTTQTNRCHRCSFEVAESSHFCPNCGEKIQTVPLTEKLKVVTVLFCDLVDSTELTARLGDKIAGDLNRDCHEIVTKAVERYGGACGRWAGDGVMAVFGVPTLNDDDAIRAARVAVQIRDDIGALSAEFYRIYGMPVEVRIGINTGQALVRSLGPIEERVAGLQVTLARRLEQAADPDAILVGEVTFRLIQDAATAEPIYPPIRLEGIPDPVPAWRLLTVDEADQALRPDGPLIGRSRDLTILLQLLDRVIDDRACHIVTIIGLPGIGKSRLIREFERQVQDATVFRSACKPYGEGVTFWPIAEMVRQAAGVMPDDSPARALERLGKIVARETDGRRIVRRVGQLLGWGSDATVVSDVELRRALSRLFRVLAREQPLALIFDDLQWADQGLIDSIREIASSSSDLPIMLICMARQELIDERPDWAAGLLNSTTLLLPPFNDRDGDRLVKHLLEGRRMSGEEELLHYIQEHSEGNPLFMESYLAMLQERQHLQKDQHGQWQLNVSLKTLGEQVPPRLQMVISARLERLEAPLRSLLERAAVVGGQFHAANVIALSPDDEPGEVLGNLERLAQKGLIIPDPAAAAKLPLRYGKVGYRIRHMLYRDVAYASLPEDEVAELHERYADWLEGNSTDSDNAEIQIDEIIAYHLLQTYQKRVKTNPNSPGIGTLALRAAERLLTAGRRAKQRGDLTAALSSLDQAVALLPADHPQLRSATLDLADVLQESDANRAATLYGDVDRLAAAADDERTAMHAQIGALDLVGFYADPAKPLEDVEEVVQHAIAVFERHGDLRGLAQAWRLRGYVQYATGHNSTALDSIALAQEHAARAQDERLEASVRALGCIVLFWGPTPLSGVKPKLEETLAWARSKGSRGLEATVLGLLARSAAMGDDFTEARQLNAVASEIRKGIGERMTAAADSMSVGLVELLDRDLGAAEQVLRQGYEDLRRMGGISPLVNVAVLLARTLLLQGELAEAEELTIEVEKAVPVSLLDTRIKWRSIRAVIKARRGESAEAERLITEAVAFAERIEQPDSKAEAYRDQAEIMQLLGRHEEAAKAVDRSYKLYLGQGNLSAAKRVQRLIKPQTGQEQRQTEGAGQHVHSGSAPAGLGLAARGD